jgi:hypothetical protein
MHPYTKTAGDGLNPSRRVVYIQQKYGFPSYGRLFLPIPPTQGIYLSFGDGTAP